LARTGRTGWPQVIDSHHSHQSRRVTYFKKD
jgi:hypothetical protein